MHSRHIQLYTTCNVGLLQMKRPEVQKVLMAAFAERHPNSLAAQLSIVLPVLHYLATLHDGTVSALHKLSVDAGLL